MTGQLNIANSKLHNQDLRRTAETNHLLLDAEQGETNQRAQVVIRAATPADDETVKRLAQLDSRPLPRTTNLLLAEVEGEVRAALPLDDGPAIADPFHPTLELVEMLKARAAQLRGEQATGGRLRRSWSALRRAASRPVMAPLAGDVSVPVRNSLPVRREGE